MPRTLKNNKVKQKATFITLCYLCTTILWVGVVVYAGFFVPALVDQNSDVFSDPRQIVFRFGFNQLHYLNPVLIIFIVFLMYMLSSQIPLIDKAKRSFAKIFSLKNTPLWLSRIVITLFCTLLFWLFRSYYANIDFLAFKRSFPDAVERGLLQVRFDEMWETFLHFEAAKSLNKIFGLTVDQTFQIISMLAGSGFVNVALILSRELNPEKPYSVFLVLLSGGFMQLFFGDLEFYSICGLLIFLYFLGSYLFLKGNVSVLIPAFILTLAMTFHMEAVYLFPSLIFLLIVQLSKREFLPILFALLLFIGFLSWTLLFFVSRGASLQRLIGASWGLGRGGSVLANIVKFDLQYFWGQLNLLGLLFPAIWFLFPLIITGGIEKSVFNGFLVIASICGLLFFFLWSSSIGLYMDWNLFALPLLPIILLFTHNLTRQDFPYKKLVFRLVFVLAYLSTYAWIYSNHSIGF